jgi:hypothetical protein
MQLKSYLNYVKNQIITMLLEIKYYNLIFFKLNLVFTIFTFKHYLYVKL